MQKNIRNSITEYINSLLPGKILDIPSGSCWLKNLLESPEWEYYPADFYSDSSARNFQKVDLNDNLPHLDSHFDYVACFEGLEHIENYHQALREFSRVLKNKGHLMISTPNPLNIKSRIRYFLIGTFYGFPHLTTIPPEGEHLHMTPINLSFLIAFAEKYKLKLSTIHKVRIKPKMYRFIAHYIFLKLYISIKLLFKDNDTKQFIKRFFSMNVLFNDNILLTFKKGD